MRSAFLLTAMLALAVGAACSHDDRAPAAEMLTGEGLAIELPQGWDGRITRRIGVEYDQIVLQAGNFELPAEDDDIASVARREMGGAGVVVSLVVGDGAGPESWDRAVLPIAIRPSDIDSYEGFAPNAAGVRHLVVAGRALSVYVAFGTVHADKNALEEANSVLETLVIGKPPVAAERVVRHFRMSSGSGLQRFEFSAPDPAKHGMDVYLSSSRDVDLALAFRTPDGSELPVLDSAGRECERDERMGCEVHLSALQNVAAGRWSGELRKRSGSATDVTVRVVFVPVEP
jgi:hypothetical protein